MRQVMHKGKEEYFSEVQKRGKWLLMIAAEGEADKKRSYACLAISFQQS